MMMIIARPAAIDNMIPIEISGVDDDDDVDAGESDDTVVVFVVGVGVVWTLTSGARLMPLERSCAASIWL